MVVTSLAVSLEVMTSPPPETVAVLVRLEGAVPATLTVSVIAEKLEPAVSALLRVQGPNGWVQLHPVPDMAVPVRPAGRLSVTVTVPVVEAKPLLVTVIL